ncbi:peptide-methionine (S)-S-oxide reductase [Scopulibacillus darangshiensis]|uniref:Peptide methionine sulfoxide reductase MsrA n=1 Tax=Scopulibacillus darangshiensis TaxID=442528 RepID=A0A4R2P2E7_9BACL|nr:peptide-methionine (S)-S-oxide reductase MsrA [Scopulibacillus darangshiensis]TCP28727.1 peptide-methionine (S)-S-oxide reductase [Scopulibacillus darangshiensis]
MKDKNLEQATFAGGCFWCMVKPFDEQPGIHQVVSGYSGGHVKNPTYEEVCTGKTGHYEVVQITFDPEVFPYEELLALYWPQTDPTDEGGQFFDRGPQYRTAIFYHNDRQKAMAEQSKLDLEKSGRFNKPIVTQILPAATFYPAEAYHQHFYKKNPDRYKEERAESGRNQFIQKNW